MSTDFAKVEAELNARGFTRMVFDLSRIEALLDLLGQPAAGVPGDPPHRHQRQDLDRPHDRLAAARARAADRPLHQPAPGDRAGADQHRRRAGERGEVRRDLRRGRAGGELPRPARRRGER